MRAPTLITRSCIPKDNEPSHSPTIVVEKHDMALLGFTNTVLNDQEAYDFSEYLLSNWLTDASPATKGNHAENTLPLLATPLAQSTTISEPGTVKPWTLMLRLLTLPLWVTSEPLNGCKWDSTWRNTTLSLCCSSPASVTASSKNKITTCLSWKPSEQVQGE